MVLDFSTPLKRSRALYIEDCNGVARIEFSRSVAYVAALKLVAAESGEGEELDPLTMRSIVETLAQRSDRAAYLITTVISRSGVSTYALVSSSDRETTEIEREVVAGIVETVSRGLVRCLPASFSEIMLILDALASRRNMLRELLASLRRESRESSVPELHVPSSEPSPRILEPELVEYVRSVVEEGTIYIGRLAEYPDIEVRLREDHIYRHIAIVGSTGSGKSTTAAVLACEAAKRGYSVLVIDWHGEYQALLSACRASKEYTNPLKGSIPKHLELTQILRKEPLAFIEILESGLDLTPAQVHILEEAINVLRSREFHGYAIDLIADIVQTSSVAARWYTESREALLRKLKPLTSQYLSISWSRCRKVDLETGKVTIFDVSSIPNVRVRKVLSSLLIRSVALEAQYSSSPRPTLIVVDEAHHVFDENNPISSLVAEVRKWRLGFAIISQAPSMLSTIVLKNTNTKIVHALKASQDVNAVLSSIVGGRRISKAITALKPGEAFLVLPEVAIPIHVKIDVESMRRA